MRTPTSSQLLDAWERAFDSRSAERALVLLALALPELGYDGVAQCSIGTRDNYLLSLRVRLFGTELGGIAHCPACQTMIETSWSAAQLRASLAAPVCGPVLELFAQDHRISYRLPNTDDLLAIGEGSDPAAARNLLLTRCVLSASCGESDAPSAALPEATLEALEAAMAEADPMADIECALACPACEHQWNVQFDIARYLWSELHAWAQRLLVDVHQLARAYGWREADILALSPARRSLYVEMSAS